MTGLTIQDLYASHGRTQVLSGVDLTVEKGSLACVLGPSGCGKSTLLRVIAGFHPATRGQVALSGRLLDDGRSRLPAERRRIGYVPQDGALFPHLTVAANIGFGLPRAQRAGRVAELLDLVGLAGLGGRHPHQLSGGQQQRVALARALAPQPELLLLDEPFAALDAALRSDVRAEVAATLRRAGATAILVTHDQDEALSFADTIAVMRDGRIAQTGSPQALYREPADARTARFLGEANLLTAELDGSTASTALGVLPLTEGSLGTGRQLVMLRPRQLQLASLPGGDAVRAEVVRCLFRGHDYRVELAPETVGGLPERLVAYTDSAPFEIGAQVYVQVSGAAHPVGDAAAEPAAARPPATPVPAR
ncbi:ABC transporter ATP-binding protein [Kitasatospora sp. MAP5-34]|uniref:ABC transporter ATP-binding protein n=1 Tax=Kitasatospora sp. MAP5-34 TaxID=3035102 RepID=UPI0024748FDF|nr:ABC transporter ATP-binding protein [Kitasatospora sp. MAP5-34]MDH6579125.1 iron(III) transport system ATP-binding protein [Kitasatospora sp. MAP5-34]